METFLDFALFGDETAPKTGAEQSAQAAAEAREKAFEVSFEKAVTGRVSKDLTAARVFEHNALLAKVYGTDEGDEPVQVQKKLGPVRESKWDSPVSFQPHPEVRASSGPEQVRLVEETIDGVRVLVGYDSEGREVSSQLVLDRDELENFSEAN